MSKKNFLKAGCLLFFAVLLFAGNSVQAATSIIVEADNLTVQAGETFDFNITVTYINPGTDLITGGDFDLFFSPDFIVNSITPGPGLGYFFGNPDYTTTPGFIDHIEVNSFTGVGPQLFATISFTAPDFITNTTVDFQDGGNGWGILGSPDLADVTYNFGNIAVVPEPVSSILFIAGGAVLGVRRYRKKRDL